MGEMIKMVVVLTVLSVVSGGSLSWLKDFTEPKIENSVMNLVKGPAIRNMLSEAENDPVKDRFKIKDGDVEKNVFVGVFGGTFDPIHLGHLRTAEEIGQQLTLEKVYLIPSASPPHKTGDPVYPNQYSRRLLGRRRRGRLQTDRHRCRPGIGSGSGDL